MIRNDIDHVLISEDELEKTVSRLAEEITRDYGRPDKNLVLLCILKGSIIFMSDLMKKLTIPVEIDCMRVSSYGSGTTSGGHIKIVLDLDRPDIRNCDLLIIEDIIESGLTMKEMLHILGEKKPKEVFITSLFVKPNCLKVDLKIDYRCFDIEDDFIVGYGLDYNHEGRNLPHIYQVIE